MGFRKFRVRVSWGRLGIWGIGRGGFRDRDLGSGGRGGAGFRADGLHAVKFEGLGGWG